MDTGLEPLCGYSLWDVDKKGGSKVKRNVIRFSDIMTQFMFIVLIGGVTY